MKTTHLGFLSKYLVIVIHNYLQNFVFLCREIAETFTKEVISLCYINLSNKLENEVLDKILKGKIASENLVHTLSQALLRIIPNIILNKREEVIPLLVSAVHLNPDVAERDKLLQQLFNLKKKPSEVERTMILTGMLKSFATLKYLQLTSSA